jgi:hypothetical protein
VDGVLTIDSQPFRRVDAGRFEWADRHSDMRGDTVEWERVTPPEEPN